MAALLRFAEAGLLVAMGTFMAVLAQSSLYWQFLNPKYSWLTLIAGIALAIVGFACLLNTERKRKVSELLSIVIFIGLAWTGITTSQDMYADVLSEPTSGSLTREFVEDGSTDGEPTIQFNGVAYQKINVAELLKGEMDKRIAAGESFAFQGAVVRSPELDEAGYIAIGRLLITCCFADSTGAVSLVKVDDPNMFVSGSWARVLGVLEEGSPFPGDTITLSGALTAVRSEKFVMRGVEVREAPVEGVPFIFEIREEAPYAY